jgi:hypothetical protein
MEFLTGRLGLSSAVVLSGDVHYGLNVDVRFTARAATIHLAQLVSSGLKHSGTITKALLHLVGLLNRPRHERVGWARPPDAQRARDVGRWIMRRRVNTDEWAPGAPVFLAPAVADQLGITQPPDYREVRTYIRPAGPAASALIGENNIGSVTVAGHKITHVLLARSQRTTEHRADLDVSARG